jgi:hypothetical protein
LLLEDRWILKLIYPGMSILKLNNCLVTTVLGF